MRNHRSGDGAVRACGLILAWLALLSQLVLGTLVLPDTAPDPGLDRIAALSVICRPGHPPPDRHPLPHLPSQEHALLALAATVALPGIILTTVAALPAPGVVSIPHAVILPPPRAPPVRFITDGAPRGPPAT